MDRLSEIRARCDAATPGPWQHESDYGAYIRDANGANVCLLYHSEDAAFIAHAREDIPYLLTEVERLSGDYDEANRAYHEWFKEAQNATARAEKAEAELCQCCRAFSDATGHGWDENCEVCKFGPLPEPPEGE